MQKHASGSTDKNLVGYWTFRCYQLAGRGRRRSQGQSDARARRADYVTTRRGLQDGKPTMRNGITLGQFCNQLDQLGKYDPGPVSYQAASPNPVPMDIGQGAARQLSFGSTGSKKKRQAPLPPVPVAGTYSSVVRRMRNLSSCSGVSSVSKQSRAPTDWCDGDESGFDGHSDVGTSVDGATQTIPVQEVISTSTDTVGLAEVCPRLVACKPIRDDNHDPLVPQDVGRDTAVYLRELAKRVESGNLQSLDVVVAMDKLEAIRVGGAPGPGDKPVFKRQETLPERKRLRRTVDQELYGYLRLEAMYEPRTAALQLTLKKKAMKFLERYNESSFTRMERYEMILAAVTHAMVVDEAELQPREVYRRAVKDMWKHKKLVNGEIGPDGFIESIVDYFTGKPSHLPA